VTYLAPDDEHDEAEDGCDHEDKDREAQGPRRNHVLAVVVDGADDPGEAESEEDIDGVGASDVADGGVGRVRLLRSRHGGEGVGQRRAQRHERDSRHALSDAESAPQQRRRLPHHRRHQPDHRKSSAERHPAVLYLRRRNQGEEELPPDGCEVHEGFRTSDEVDFIIIIY